MNIQEMTNEQISIQIIRYQTIQASGVSDDEFEAASKKLEPLFIEAMDRQAAGNTKGLCSL